jgi:hypothetical protein
MYFKFVRPISVIGHHTLPMRLVDNAHTLIDITGKKVMKSEDKNFVYPESETFDIFPLVDLHYMEKMTNVEFTVKMRKII